MDARGTNQGSLCGGCYTSTPEIHSEAGLEGV